MRNYTPTSLIVLLALVGISLAEEKPPQDQARSALARLKAECDVAGQSNSSLWTSYVSATEKARHEIIAQLKSLGAEIVPFVRAEFQHGKGEYREMLTLALAALGDDAALLSAADVLLVSERPAVRVCAAWQLRGVKDKRTIEQLKKALRDSYKRQDGGCVRIGEGMIYPVRIIASD